MEEVENIKRCVAADGLFSCKDNNVGPQVDRFIRDGLPYDTLRGLQFLQQNVLENSVLRGAIEAVFETSIFSFYRGYGYDTERAFSIIRNSKAFGDCLMVQIWGSDATGVFYKNSHVASLQAKQAGNGLLEVPFDELLKHPVEGVRQHFEHGGWTIADARLAFSIERGFVIIALFATEQELEIWQSRMVYPKHIEIKELIESLESSKIKFNIELRDLRSSGTKARGEAQS